MDNPKKLATYDAQDEQKTKQNTICIGHHYTQTNTNNINKALAIPAQKQYNVRTFMSLASVFRILVHKDSLNGV
jgi:hypothetical protein